MFAKLDLGTILFVCGMVGVGCKLVVVRARDSSDTVNHIIL